MERKSLNQGWVFAKHDAGIDGSAAEGTQTVTLPHTWNAVDGQDGGNDYYRGKCWYYKELSYEIAWSGKEIYLEFEGAAMSAQVYVGGKFAGSHQGGYSAFRFNITPYLEKGRNDIAVCVTNEKNRTVYPQKADFTFYGGLYRNVNLIVVPKVHFDLDYCGTYGIRVTPQMNGRNADVQVEAWVSGKTDSVTFEMDGQQKTCSLAGGYAAGSFQIKNAHLWDGIADPYLYTASAFLSNGEKVQLEFGCRSFRIDPEKGFFLNDRPYRLCGAARHQDRLGMGNALTGKEHEEDIDLMLEMGANCVRLAHYQQDQYVYDLCDRKGLIVWAEIPYISEHMEEACENALSQMKELVLQNDHHPSIICWGLSNEITASTGVTDQIIMLHRKLNELCHRLDQTRPTTMANVFMLDAEDPFICIPDIRSYNLYYGWYVGTLSQNDSWFDNFHAKHPDMAIGLSEYGADANPAYQSSKPEKGDWSEQYQALYHEHMLKMWSERPYIWSMFCWNMFDFGADGRDEGGKPGQNQKGLVTFDRKIRKDAFYIYKAYLSREAFVHICGSRYVNRAESETEIRIYSNLSEVTLYLDGRMVETQKGDKVFTFSVPITAVHEIEAVSGKCKDRIIIRHVEKEDTAYMKPGRDVTNWFDQKESVAREGFFSIKDSKKTIKESKQTAKLYQRMVLPIEQQAAKRYGDVSKIRIPENVQRMIDAQSMEDTLREMGDLVTPEFVHRLNDELNQIAKSK